LNNLHQTPLSSCFTFLGRLDTLTTTKRRTLRTKSQALDSSPSDLNYISVQARHHLPSRNRETAACPGFGKPLPVPVSGVSGIIVDLLAALHWYLHLQGTQEYMRSCYQWV
jgi:hypothetical protein